MTRASLCLTLTLLATAAVAAPRVPVPVSPGAEAGVTLISQSCPTFSWESASGASWVDLVVYGLPEQAGLEAGSERPLIERRLPGGATAWTPPLVMCLEKGGRYAWSIRAGRDDKAGEWAAPSLFELTSRPTVEEVEAALRVLRDHLGGEDDDAPSIVPGGGASVRAPAMSGSAPARALDHGDGDRPETAGLDAAELDVAGTIEGDALRLSDVGGNFIVWEMQEEANNDMTIDYVGEVARFTATGALGIGTGETVDQKLHVNGTAQVNTLRLEDTAGNGIFWDVAEDALNNLIFTYVGERLRVSAGGVMRLGNLAASGNTMVCVNGNLDLANCAAGGLEDVDRLVAEIEAQRQRISELEALLCGQGVSASFCPGR